MTNDRYIAILKNYAGESDSAFCTVLAKQISKSIDGFLIEDEEMLRDFNGVKEIYVPKLRQHNFREGDILSFIGGNVIEEKGRNPRLHYLSVDRSFAPICIELNSIEADDVFLNIELLEETILSKYTASETNFYVSDGIYVYGSFKIERNQVKASFGVTVDRYLAYECLKIDHPSVENNDISLLLHIPKGNLKKVDCSRDTQLIESVKANIFKSRMTDETRRYINTIKDLIASENLDELQLAKMKKVQTLLDKLSFTYNEYETLRNNSSFWSKVFDNSIKDFEDYLKKEFLDKNKVFLELEVERESNKLRLLQKQISDVEVKIEEISKISQNKNQIIETLTNQITLLEERRDEIILSMQIQGGIKDKASKEIVSNFEIQKTSSWDKNLYDRVSDFLDDLTLMVELDEQTEEKLFQVIKQLKDGKFFNCDNIQNFLALVHVLGNSHIYLNNAEVDWIKFDKFVKQGLLNAFECAYKNPSQSVYYLLQDFNIASPECYAKPLIDVSRNIRKTLPIDGRTWPSNLRVVFFPLELDVDDFGFEVNDETFSSWEELDVPSIAYDGDKLSIALNLELR